MVLEPGIWSMMIWPIFKSRLPTYGKSLDEAFITDHEHSANAVIYLGSLGESWGFYDLGHSARHEGLDPQHASQQCRRAWLSNDRAEAALDPAGSGK
jgi:hypothetical protein